MDLINTNVNNKETEGLTIFYSKRTGEIISYSACSTPQTFEDYWGTRAEDMKLIYNTLFTDFDMDIINNIKDYHVINDILTKKVNPLEGLKKENNELNERISSIENQLNYIINTISTTR